MAKRISTVADADSPRIASRKVLAEIFDISVNTIDNWVARGCPIWRRGAPGIEGLYDIAAVFQWKINESVERVQGRGDTQTQTDEAKRRKMLADAENAELDLAERRRELVNIELVGILVADQFANVRSRVLTLRGLAPQLAHLTDAAQIDRVLFTALSEALEELSADTNVAEAYDKLMRTIKPNK